MTISNIAFSKSSLTVVKGSKLVFTNNDAADYKLTLANFSPMTVPAGASLDFDTSLLFPGNYVFYSEQYPTLRLNLIVQ